MLRLEPEKPDVAFAIAVACHLVAVIAIIWNSVVAVPASASLLDRVNEAESTIDIIFFADKVASVVKSAASRVERPLALPKAPDYQIPELPGGNALTLRGSDGARYLGAEWAMPSVPERDTIGDVLDVNQLAGGPRFTPFSRAPKLTNQDEIKKYLTRRFPIGLRRAGGEARSIVWLLIDTSGRVFKAVLHETSGRPDADSLAVAASHKMVFSPAEQAGRPIPVWVQQPVRLHVQDVP